MLRSRLSRFRPAGKEFRLRLTLAAFILRPWRSKTRRCWHWSGRYWWRLSWSGHSSSPSSMSCGIWFLRSRCFPRWSMRLAPSAWWCSFTCSIERSRDLSESSFPMDGPHWVTPISRAIWGGLGCPQGFGSAPAFQRCRHPLWPPQRPCTGTLLPEHCDSIGVASANPNGRIIPYSSSTWSSVHTVG